MPARAASIIAGLCCASGVAGCTHITHPAEVRPGVRLDLSAGVGAAYGSASASTESKLRALSHLQLNAGYGWRFNDDQALATTLMLPLVTIEALGTRGARTHPTQTVGFDAYWQIQGEPDWGLGAVIDRAPRVYAMLGQDTRLSTQVSFRWDAKVAVGAVMTTEGRSTLIVAQGVSGRFELGAWDLGLWTDVAFMPAGHPGESGDGGARLAFGSGVLLGLRWAAIEAKGDPLGPEQWP